MTTYELLTVTNKTVSWSGETPEDACERAADCLGVAITAWRLPRTAILVGTSQIIG